MSRLRWHDIDDEGLANGTYTVTVASGVVTGLTALASGVSTVTGSGLVTVDNTDPANPVVSSLMLLTTVVGGVPDLVWDGDNQLVYTEAP